MHNTQNVGIQVVRGNPKSSVIR